MSETRPTASGIERRQAELLRMNALAHAVALTNVADPGHGSPEVVRDYALTIARGFADFLTDKGSDA